MPTQDIIALLSGILPDRGTAYSDVFSTGCTLTAENLSSLYVFSQFCEDEQYID